MSLHQLYEELIAIGRAKGIENAYLDNSTGEANPRVREIGEMLDRLGEEAGMGGNKVMVQACGEVRRELGDTAARLLEAAWDGIGSWRG